MKVPFSVYDFLAYISSGILVIATVDVVYGSAWLLGDDHALPLGIVGAFAAYVAGHVVAQMSSLVLEQFFVGKVLKRPSERLMSSSKPMLRLVFPNYFRALPDETKERIEDKLAHQGVNATGEAVFLHIFGTLKRRPDIKERIDSFRNLYGFARNMCMAMLVSAAMVFAGPFDDRAFNASGYGIALLALAIVMLYRYLKFFRHYSYELFVSFAAAPEKEI